MAPEKGGFNLEDEMEKFLHKAGQGASNLKDEIDKLQHNPSQAAFNLKNETDKFLHNAGQWAQDHPFAAVGVGLGGAALIGPGLITAPVLGLLGVGCGGVVGGEFFSFS